MRVTQLIARGLLCPLFTLTALVASAAMRIDVENLYSGWGTVTPESATISSGSATFVATPKQGYKVNGWMIEPEELQIQRNGAQVTVPYDANVNEATLTPLFSYGVYTVTFDPRGGMIDGASTITVTNKQNYANLPTPDWSGHVFKGWFDGDTQIKNGDPIWLTNDTTLYAQWADADVYEIRGVAEPSEGGTVTGGTTTYSGREVTLEAVANTGYNFFQWDDDATAPAKRTVVVGEKGMTYTAIFTANVYRVVFNVVRQEATVSPAEKSVTFGERYGQLPKPDCPDYEFQGWYADTDYQTSVSQYDSVNTTGKDGVITLYAKWQKIPVFFVAFDGNGATDGLMATQKIVRGVSTALTSNAFTRVGYTYDGWTNATGRAYADGASVYNLADEDATVTLYAKWTPNKYHVIFDSNGQRGTMSPVSNCTYGVAFDLPENKFVNLTGEFLGWSMDKTATAAEWTDKASVKNLATGGTVTLYAVWKSLINDLTTAAHCKNVVLTTGGQNLFTVYTDDTGYTSVKSGQRSATDMGAPYNWGSWLMLTVGGRGTLTYHCKFTSADVANKVLYYSDTSAQGTQLTWNPGDDGWMTVSETYTSDGDHTVKWASVITDATQYLLVDRVVWMPEGDVVEPTEADAPTIGGFESTADGFSLSFTSDERFDYRVLSTTSLVAPIVWEPDAKMRLEGTGGTLTFQIEGTDPARFFKVEVLARGAE